MSDILFQTSLIAAFIAGMVALFAPCCITFLLPAYLGSVFKEKEKVVFMTLVFGLGIFIVLLPAVLGVAFISRFLFRYHDKIYLIGGFLMILVSLITFLGIKFPMPRISASISERTDVLSIFTLGIFSGITSACCAPVLIGILTLSFLSPSFFGALIVGAMYVLGMVFPLLLISVFLSGKMPEVKFLRGSLGQISLFGKRYLIVVSNLIAGSIFLITGILTLFLLFSGRLVMGASAFTIAIKNTAMSVNRYLGQNIIANVLFLAIVAYLIYRISKKI